MILAALVFTYIRGISSCGGGVSSSNSGPKPKSIIFFISDGMGPGYVTAARDAQLCSGGGVAGELQLESHLVGMSRTRSANSLVTDSAAGATAYSTGFKTDNHVVVGLHVFVPAPVGGKGGERA